MTRAKAKGVRAKPLPTAEEIAACFCKATPGLWWVAERCGIKYEKWLEGGRAVLGLFSARLSKPPTPNRARARKRGGT